jgi:hypothetical protein
MATASGIVEFISIKQMPTEDKYGNKFRASYKIGEDWYSHGTIKQEKIGIKDGQGWHDLAKGDTIEFMYDQNGDFKNVKKATVSITEKGAGASQNTPQSTPAPTKAAGGGKPFVNAAEVGQCMNLAVQLGMVKDYKGFTDEAIRACITEYKSLRQRFHDMYLEEPKKPAPKKAPVNAPVDDEEDI